MDPVTENPAVGATEVWEIYNTTGDAHPCTSTRSPSRSSTAQGLVLDEDDEVVQPIQLDGDTTPPEPWENGCKDTVIAYPGQVTRRQGRSSPPPASSSGTATSSSTRTTR